MLVNLLPKNQNSTPSSKGRGGRNGRGRGRGGFRPMSGKILCYWCQDFVSEEEASHKIANCPYQSTARSDWCKAQMDKKSTHSTDPKTFADIDFTPKVRKGFRRKVNLPMFVT